MIKEDFDAVIAWSQDYDHPETDQLFKDWAEAKKDFIAAFGDKLIYEVPELVAFPLDNDTKQDRWLNFIQSVRTYGELHNFLYKQGTDAFFENKIRLASIAPDGTPLPQGMKLIKAFKYFLPAKILAEWQDAASRMIQDDKVIGKLCFSVHPLDFLSLSENTYNWRSCHALDGEYRCGNLSYMTDKSTVICYLKGEEEAQLPHFGDILWNSKKWRMLLFFSDTRDSWFAGRQYPFFSKTALDVVRETFPQHNPSRWSYWHDDLIGSLHYAEHDYPDFRPSSEKYCNFGGKLIPLRGAIDEGKDSRNFNDLLRSTVYSPYYGWKKTYGIAPNNIHFTIGAAAPCICCGSAPIRATDSMFCKDCELTWGSSEDEDLYPRCIDCDERGYADDMEWLNGEPLCPTCFATNYARCEKCGDIYYQENMHFGEQILCPLCAKRDS